MSLNRLQTVITVLSTGGKLVQLYNFVNTHPLAVTSISVVFFSALLMNFWLNWFFWILFLFALVLFLLAFFGFTGKTIYFGLLILMILFLISGIFVFYIYLYPPTPESICNNIFSNSVYEEALITMGNSNTCNSPFPLNKTTPIKSLPYIDSVLLLNRLVKYACTYPSKAVLVIWGPQSYGKTAGILEVKNNVWLKGGRAIIQLDLQEFKGNIDEFKEYFKKTVLKCLERFSFTNQHLRTWGICSGKKKIDRESPISPSFTQSLLISLGFYKTAEIHSLEVARWFNDLETIIFYYFSSEYQELGVDVEGIFNILELIALQQPELAPVVILNEIQLLNNIQGQPIIDQILKIIQNRKNVQSLVPIIIESSDYMWLVSSALMNSEESFQSFLLYNIDYDITKKELVNDLKIFSNSDFEIIWKFSKGHPGTIKSIYDRIQNGLSLNQAIEEKKDSVMQYFVSVLNNDQNKETIKVLLELMKNGWELKNRYPLENKALEYLIKKNILFVKYGTIVKPQNQVYQSTIETYLYTFYPLPLIAHFIMSIYTDPDGQGSWYSPAKRVHKAVIYAIYNEFEPETEHMEYEQFIKEIEYLIFEADSKTLYTKEKIKENFIWRFGLDPTRYHLFN